MQSWTSLEAGHLPIPIGTWEQSAAPSPIHPPPQRCASQPTPGGKNTAQETFGKEQRRGRQQHLPIGPLRAQAWMKGGHPNSSSRFYFFWQFKF